MDERAREAIADALISRYLTDHEDHRAWRGFVAKNRTMEHGDCTTDASTCLRCVVDDELAVAGKISAALDAAGYVVVPKKATRAMIEAGGRHTAAYVWRAMVAAAGTP